VAWHTAAVRWEELYDAAAEAEFAGEVADRTRRERALVPLADRLRASTEPVTVGIAPQTAITGAVCAVGADWILLTDDRGEVIVRTGAILWVRGLPPEARAETSAVAARLDFGYALRVLARDRAAAVVQLVDGTTLTGTIDRVGRDAFDLAEHAADEPRRSGLVRSARVVAFAAVTSVRRT